MDSGRIFHPFLLVILWTVADTFNLDVTAPIVQSINDTTAYFGYSIAMHRHGSDNMLIVGAPRYQTTVPDVNRGGALFRCPLTPYTEPTACEELTMFNDIGNDFNEQGSPITNRTNQWFGASVKSSGPDGQIVACRPLYTWFIRPDGSAADDVREPIGGCYVASSDFSNINTYEPCRAPLVTDQTVYGVTHCQAGISADISEDEILIGAPGSYFWQGQIYVTNSDRQAERKTAEGPISFDDSYRGYAVAFGNFKGDSRTEYAVGIPRARAQDSNRLTKHCIGMVSIYDSNMDAYLNLTGSQVGAYFGHTLAVSDFNNDGLDDIVVGAPFYIDESKAVNGWEIGRIDIFYNDLNGGFSDGISMMGHKVRERFGAAMAALTDVNQDGFNDLAVSAPYGGENGEGIVYIYHGQGLRGLSSTVAQTLEPSDFGLSLSTFGHSLSAGLDMDNNMYPDLVIGAYKSGTVVVVRSRPIVQLSASLKAGTRGIVLDEMDYTLADGTQVTSFNLSVCITYSGTNVPENLDAFYSLALDYTSPTGARALVVQTGSDLTTYSETISLTSGVETCAEHTSYIKPTIVDKLSPIDVRLVFRLADKIPDPGEILPILSETTNNVTTTSVPIIRDCQNETCVPNFAVNASTDGLSLVVGKSETVTVNVTISNSGEDGYQSTLVASLPEELQYAGSTRTAANQIVSCTNMVQSSEIICDVGNPFEAGSTIELQMQFSSSNLPGNRERVTFGFQVQSVDREQITSDNAVNVTIPLQVSAELSFYGVGFPEKLIYSESDYQLGRYIQYEQEVGPELSHVFSLYNNGPSSIGNTRVTIQWPMRYDTGTKGYLLYLSKVTMDTGEECDVEGTINPEKLKQNGTSVQMSSSRRRRATSTDLPPSMEATTSPPGSSPTEPPVVKAVFECDDARQDLCYQITCDIPSLGAGSNARDNVVITARSRVWTNTLTSNSLELTVIVQAHATVLNVPYVTPYTQQITVSSNPVETLIIPQFLLPEVVTQKIALWVYLVSVLCGCFILILLIVILWRVGFFKRKKITPDEREKLKSKSATDCDGQGVDNAGAD